MKIISFVVFAAAVVVGATQVSAVKATVAQPQAPATAKQGCHHDQDCGMHFRCDADGSIWTEGHCWK